MKSNRTSNTQGVEYNAKTKKAKDYSLAFLVEITDDNTIVTILLLSFSSSRLLVMTDKDGIIRAEDTVLSEYNGIYLIQYNTPQEAEEAYGYYYYRAEVVEPDSEVYGANDAAEGKTVLDNETNPLEELNSLVGTEESTAQSDDVVIALLDSGASGANVISSVSMIGGDGSDDNGHGTEMVNAILSENPFAHILSVKVLDSEAKGSVSSIIAGIEYAIEKDVDVINLSISARNTAENSAIREEVEKAIDADIIVIGTAGNNNQSTKWFTPANIEKAVIVNAAGEDGKKVNSSNYGETVDYSVYASTSTEAAAKMSGIIKDSARRPLTSGRG